MMKDAFTTGPAVRRAADALGSQQALAELLQCSEAFVSYMANGIKRVPRGHVERICKATGVPAWELRPDIYPAPQSSAAA